MEYQCVATPQSESELAVMVCTLDAYGIPHYVQNEGFGGLYPGMQMDLFNGRRLMVPIDQATEASRLLDEFSNPSAESNAVETLTIVDRIRVIGELVLFGWAFPTK